MSLKDLANTVLRRHKELLEDRILESFNPNRLHKAETVVATNQNNVTDLLSASKLLSNDNIEIRYITEKQSADDSVLKLVEHRDFMGLDIETSKFPGYESHPQAGLEPHLSEIRLVQLYGGGDVAYVFDVKALGDLEALYPIWNQQLVAHNANFELKHLIHAGVNIQNIDCTMLQANALTGALPKLSDLAKPLLGWDIDKELQTSDWSAAVLTSEQIAYAALDSVPALKIHQIQTNELKEENKNRVYHLMRDALPSIAKMELNGIGFDSAAHNLLLNQWKTEQKTAETDLRRIVGTEINLASSKQLSEWLSKNSSINIPAKWSKTKSGQLKTDAATL